LQDQPSPILGEGENQKEIKTMSTVSCPECAAEITLAENTEVGEIIVCPDCGVDLEVTALEPATIQLAPMDQEDWGE
jgi:alpha-aminoadipate carrier protein LysW